MPLPPTEPPAGLPIWVIYDHPSDWPDHYVARRWMNDQPTGDMILTHDLDAMRRHLIEGGFARLDRNEGDDPVIVETWL